jgi:predicted CXXCH cytochrome family protein
MYSVITKARIKVFVILLLFILLLSCGTPERRYKVLTVFFDGVPKPGTQQEQEKPGEPSRQDKTPREAQRIVIRILSKHPDYENRTCDNCHDRSANNFLRAPTDRICFQCHEEEEYMGTYVHGPIAVGGCMVCHFPHESRYDKLLIANSREICLYCHQAEDVALNPSHSTLSLDVSPTADSKDQQEQENQQEQPGFCTPCHDPHKGDNRFFLRSSPPGAPADKEVTGTPAPTSGGTEKPGKTKVEIKPVTPGPKKQSAKTPAAGKSSPGSAPLTLQIKSIDHKDYTRVVLEGDRVFQSEARFQAKKIIVPLKGISRVKKIRTAANKSTMILRVDYDQDTHTLIIVFKVPIKIKKSFAVNDPYRVVFDVVSMRSP